MSAKYSRIISTGSALPAARITNEDLARRLAADGIETSDEWIRTRTGIEARRFVNGTTETTTTLAAAAAQKALEGGGVDPKTIDLIIVATTTPDQVFPSTAAAVQRLMGARRSTYRPCARALFMRLMLPMPCSVQVPISVRWSSGRKRCRALST